MRAEVEEALRPDIEQEIRDSIEVLEGPPRKKKRSAKKSKTVVVVDEGVPLEDNVLPGEAAEPAVAGQEVEEEGVAPPGKAKGRGPAKTKAKTTANPTAKKSAKKIKRSAVVDEDVAMEDNPVPEEDNIVPKDAAEEEVTPQGHGKEKGKTKAGTKGKATSKAPAKKKSSQKVTTGRIIKNKGRKVTTKVAQLLESVASDGEEATPQESGQGGKSGAPIPENDQALPVKKGPTSAPVAGNIISAEQNAVPEGVGENHEPVEGASNKRASDEVVSREGSTEQQDESEREDPEEDTLAKMAREALEKQERAERARERAFFLSTQDNAVEDEANDYHGTSNYSDVEDEDEEGDPDDYI